MIERIEVSIINESVHNFRRGEFGVENIEIDENRGLIEIIYVSKEMGTKKVIIPLNNVEKLEYIEKSTLINMDEGEI
jgi:phage-related protein